ncbi:hypothetical protein J6590_031065 [Homalodisca vitripennis]|nr:hypothetical protein J6590_031065 [Homalodisca vitripennis]
MTHNANDEFSYSSPSSYVQHLKYDAVSDLNPEIWSLDRLKGSKNSEEVLSHCLIRCTIECTTMLADPIPTHSGATESSTLSSSGDTATEIKSTHNCRCQIVDRFVQLHCTTCTAVSLNDNQFVSDFKADVNMTREGGLVTHMPAVYPINHTPVIMATSTTRVCVRNIGIPTFANTRLIYYMLQKRLTSAVCVSAAPRFIV